MMDALNLMPPVTGGRSVASSLRPEPERRGQVIPTSSLLFRRNAAIGANRVDESPYKQRLHGRGGSFGQNTQIYEGTNQIQRVVVAKHLLK